jgi:hypothetical protein
MVDILEASGARSPKAGLAAIPTSTQSEGQIAAPFVEFGSGLRKLGESLGTLGERVDLAAVPEAQAAGLAAVGRDQQGNPTVELKPFALSKSDQAFNHAATQGLLSQYQMDAQRGLQEIAARNQSDPGAFDKESAEYVRTIGTGAKDLRPLVQAEAGKIRQQHFLTIQNQAVQRQTATAKDSILVQISSTENDIYALARQGGTGTPAFGEAQQRLAGLYTQIKANPLFGVAPDRADSEMRSTLDRATGFSMASEAVRIFDAKGYKAAQKWLVENIRDNPGLKIDDAKRSGLLEMGQNAIAMRKGENKAAVDANRSSANVLAKAMEDGKPLPQGAVDQAIETATKLGDVETAAKLLTSKQVYGRSEATRGLSDEERVRQATTAPAAPSDIHGIIVAAADRYGIDRDYALRVAHIESRFDPNAVNGGSKATGLFQFIPSTWKSYGQGQSALDPAANADAGMRFSVANRDYLRRAWGREPTSGEMYLAHQQGAAGAVKLLAAPNMRAVDVINERAVLANGGTLDMTAGQFAQKWLRIGDGKAGSQPMPAVPYTRQQMAANPHLASTWLKSQLAGNRELIDSAKFVISAASNAIDKGNMPDAQTVAGAIQIANQNPDKLGRDGDELIAKIRGMDEAEEAMRSGSAAGSALVQDVMRRAQGAPIFVQMQADATKAAVERGAKNLTERPWEEAARRGWVDAPIPPLSFSSPDALQAGLAARLSVGRAISARTGQAQSVLDQQDVAAVSRVWATGAPAVQSMVAQQLGALPPEQFGMVMAEKEMRDSLIGMSRSGDPAKMATAFSLMDREQRRDPDGFSKLYGRDVENRMATWMLRSQYLTPEQLAREEARYNDPAMQKARETLRETAMAATKKLSVGDIAGYVGGSWIPFAGAGAPVTPAQEQRLIADYREEYAATFAEIGDEGKARELAVRRIAGQNGPWGVSPTNGGTLMRYPPEKANPTINGSHEWIGKQLEGEIREWLSTELSELERRLLGFSPAEPGQRRPRASEYLELSSDRKGKVRQAETIATATHRLVADDRTEAEFRSGTSPTYSVVVQAPNGMFVPLQRPDGKPLRFYADFEKAITPVRERAQAEWEYLQAGEAAYQRVAADAQRKRAARIARREAQE